MCARLVRYSVHSKLNFHPSLSGLFKESKLPCDVLSPLKEQQLSLFGCSYKNPRHYLFPNSYATSAAELLSPTESDFDEVEDSIEHTKQKPVFGSYPARVDGIGEGRYIALRKRQMEIETVAWREAAKEYEELLEDICEHKLAPNLPYMKSLFLGWFEPLKEAVAVEQKVLTEQMLDGRKKSFDGYVFAQLPAEKMAVITMHVLLGLLMSNVNGVRVIEAAVSIGGAIEQEVKIHNYLQNISKNNMDDANKSDSSTRDAIGKQKRLQKKVDKLMKQHKFQKLRKIVKEQEHTNITSWSQEIRLKVGSRLIKLLIETAYIQPPVDQQGGSPPDLRPAFAHTIRFSKDKQNSGRRYGVIDCDAELRRGLEKSPRHMVIPYMPMLIPPLKWTGYDKGAYLFLPSQVMRTHGAKEQRVVLKRTPSTQLKPVYECLNILGSTKWRINQRVLDVVERIWASGSPIAGLIDHEEVPLPSRPETDDINDILNWKWKVKSAKSENLKRHSHRCEIELKLAVARKMKDEDGFYYPHNVDFRGRAYPMHPHLNHLGSDLCRGILEFGEGRTLGKAGLRWLKIHLANLYAGGVDKLAHDDRIAFTDNHLDDIFDSANQPLEGKRWWLGAEDPFQCLAVCFAISDALRGPSSETFISHTPVHQDGSCNGLQHYAALGRDKPGAAAVNLVQGNKPADVYSGMAAKVMEIMQRDVEKNPFSTDARYAQLLKNQVDRKLVKQTVMTSVYGVTYVGARDQIRKRLKERGTIDDDQVFAVSCYAAKTTLAAMSEMFQGAKGIMEWLGDCAKVIACDNKAVQWTTPLGLPVVQPYRHLFRRMIKTSLQFLALQTESDKIKPGRQKSAFPPNFVHSLDGSHMMMTALACRKEGLDFAGVHDSYWTHACDVDKLNIILRKKFVELYEAPLLENLLLSFQRRFPGLDFPPVPERGDFDLNEVLDSPYFFN